MGTSNSSFGPTIAPGDGLTYSVTPSLPQGLTLNSSTGIISGIPTVATASTTYTITAQASAASVSTTVNIQTDSGYLINDLVHDSDSAGPGCTSGVGTCTLRAAVDSPTPPNIIQMPPGQTTLSLGRISLNHAMSIYGDCPNGTIIDGNLNPIFGVNIGPSLFTNLTLQNGNGGGSNGGGVAIGAGIQTTILFSNFLNDICSACNGGAISAIAPANLIVANSYFSNSSTLGGGSVLDVVGGGGNTSWTNSTFYNNSGPEVIYQVTQTISNCTFMNNTATQIFASDTTQITNSLFLGNTQNCAALQPVTSLGGNLTDKASTDCDFNAPTDIANTSANLGPPQNNGGPTLTAALEVGSPGIGQAVLSNCPSEDQRADPRPHLNNTCDIGAFETQP
jgi:hypothetical protein